LSARARATHAARGIFEICCPSRMPSSRNEQPKQPQNATSVRKIDPIMFPARFVSIDFLNVPSLARAAATARGRLQARDESRQEMNPDLTRWRKHPRLHLRCQDLCAFASLLKEPV